MGGGSVGIVLFSGAIIISLLAMRGRAPQWLLMLCCGWTLFTLLNVTWQPLMVFQIALIWGGYAFLAPQGLSQRKLWKSGSLEAVQNEVMNRAKGIHLDSASTPVQTAIHSHRSFGAAEPNIPIPNEK